MIKTPIALLALATSGLGASVSPDGKYSVTIDGRIQLLRAAESVLTIVQSTAGDKRIEISWSADSRKVVIIEDTARGSGVVAAFTDDGENWQKTLELDSDAAELIRETQANVGGKLVSERRNIGGWISPDEIEIKGELTFSRGKVAYTYILTFKPGEGRLDPGVFREGAVKRPKFPSRLLRQNRKQW